MSDNGLRPIMLKCTFCGYIWEPFGRSGFNVCTNCGCDWRYLDQVRRLSSWMRELMRIDGGAHWRWRTLGHRRIE
jgi:hypothetical protein